MIMETPICEETNECAAPETPPKKNPLSKGLLIGLIIGLSFIVGIACLYFFYPRYLVLKTKNLKIKFVKHMNGGNEMMHRHLPEETSTTSIVKQDSAVLDLDLGLPAMPPPRRMNVGMNNGPPTFPPPPPPISGGGGEYIYIRNVPPPPQQGGDPLIPPSDVEQKIPVKASVTATKVISTDKKRSMTVEERDTMTSELSAFLGAIKLEKYVSVLAQQEIDVETLMILSKEEMKEAGLPLGAAMKILKRAEKKDSIV